MIIDLQRRISEVGRIRIGQTVTSNGKSRPAKLDTFRLTSSDKLRIQQAAQLYGGTPAEWDAPAGKQWEVVTQADALNVIVPPSDMAFSQHYELWSGGGCQRRCDGQNESISDGQCVCDPDARECDIHTRLSVMFRDLPGLGVWRLDTQGWYAAQELSGAVGVIQMAAGTGQMLPARLRLEQRMTKRPGQGTRRFAVPVLDIEVSPAQLLAGGRSFDALDAGTVAIEAPQRQIAAAIEAAEDQRRYDRDNGSPLTPVPTSVPERPAVSIAEQATKVKERKPRKGAAQPIPATGIKPRTVAEAAAADLALPIDREILTREPPDEPEPIRPAQLKKLVILLREQGFGDDDRQARLDYCAAAIGRAITSSKDLTFNEASHIIDTLETGGSDN